jgi:hypothetical protein
MLGSPLYGEKRVNKFFSSIYDNSYRDRKPLSSCIIRPKNAKNELKFHKVDFLKLKKKVKTQMKTKFLGVN